jgi:hypothetical protein
MDDERETGVARDRFYASRWPRGGGAWHCLGASASFIRAVYSSTPAGQEPEGGPDHVSPAVRLNAAQRPGGQMWDVLLSTIYLPKQGLACAPLLVPPTTTTSHHPLLCTMSGKITSFSVHGEFVF